MSAATTAAERRAPRFGITFGQLLVFAAVALPAVVALRASMPTIDLTYQIRAGEIMLDTHHVLRTDAFTFTVFGQPWLNQQWGAQVLLGQAFRAGSWEAVSLVRAAIVATSFWLLFVACRARGAGIRPAAWLTLGGLLVAIYGFVPRPQMFAFLLFAATLAIIALRERRPGLLWLLPVITLIWANLHGSFPLVPLALLLTWLEDRRRRAPRARTLLLVGAFSVVAASLNPYGLRVWLYVVDLSTNPQVRETIEEWQPPRPTTASGFVFFASVVVVAAIAFRHRRQLGWPRLVALAVFFLLGATAIRGVIWWSLAAPVLIADLYAEREPRKRDEPRLINTAIALVLVVVGITLLPWFRPTFTSTADSGTETDGLLSFAPRAYTDSLNAEVPTGARVFAAEAWASWFEFAAPAYPVMIDPRIEIFPDDVWRDYDAVSKAAAGWEQILERRGVDVLAISVLQQSDLIAAIEGDPDWRVLYRDEDGVLLVRARS